MDNTTNIPTKSKYELGSNYTMPGSEKNFKNFFIDKKNAKAVHTKYTRFGAKRDLENGIISEGQYREVLKNLSQGKV